MHVHAQAWIWVVTQQQACFPSTRPRRRVWGRTRGCLQTPTPPTRVKHTSSHIPLPDHLDMGRPGPVGKAHLCTHLQATLARGGGNQTPAPHPPSKEGSLVWQPGGSWEGGGPAHPCARMHSLCGSLFPR